MLSDEHRPLRIAMVAACPFPTHQGTQVVIRHLATALAEAGHDVHLCTYGYGEYEADFAFAVHRAPTPNAGLRSGPSWRKPVADAALLATTRGVVERFDCDVLHVHNVEGLAIGALLKLELSVPLIYHAHNAMGPELPTYFESRPAQLFAGLIGTAIDHTLPRAADAVITFDDTGRSAHREFGVPDERIHVIPPGLDCSDLGEVDRAAVTQLRGELGEGPWLLYAGNPDGYQNLRLLWRAYARVRQQRPEVKLLIASSHPPGAFDKQLRLAPSTDGITVRRYSSPADLRALLAWADVGVCPRTLPIGVPVKVLNYVTAGLPVVACESAAPSFPPDAGVAVGGDPAEFANGIVAALSLSHGNAVHAVVTYAIERHIPMYEAVYDRQLTE